MMGFCEPVMYTQGSMNAVGFLTNLVAALSIAEENADHGVSPELKNIRYCLHPGRVQMPSNYCIRFASSYCRFVISC
jgi:hypothetical protein